MDKVVELNGVGGCIRLFVDRNEWCRCQLVADGVTDLGAETLTYIVSHLLEALDRTNWQKIGYISNCPVRWVLSLAEAHCILYAAESDSDLILIWQGKDEHVIGNLRLSAEQCRQWRNTLSALRSL